MASEPRWLEPAEVIELNRLIVVASDEPFGVLDVPMLESAVARPQNLWRYGEADAVALAVSLLFGLARNHPFQQGNKRTAFEAALIFLEANGYALDAPDTEDLAKAIINVILHEVSEEAFDAGLRPFVKPLSDRA